MINIILQNKFSWYILLNSLLFIIYSKKDDYYENIELIIDFLQINLFLYTSLVGFSSNSFILSALLSTFFLILTFMCLGITYDSFLFDHLEYEVRILFLYIFMLPLTLILGLIL